MANDVTSPLFYDALPMATSKVDASQRRIVYYARVGELRLPEGDNRANRILEASGFTQKKMWSLWSRLIDATNPQSVLDIGANYGEMTLPLPLVKQTRVDLFEPNPSLVEVLRAAALSHPSKDKFFIHEMAVSNKSGSVVMNVDLKWSGTSAIDFKSPDSPFKGKGAQDYSEISVATTALDDHLMTLPSYLHEGIFALKIDVEGHEVSVLRGAKKFLEKNFFMISEYSERQLKFAGTDLESYVSLLCSAGWVFEISDRRFKTILSASDLSSRHGDVFVTNIAWVADMVKDKLVD